MLEVRVLEDGRVLTLAEKIQMKNMSSLNKYMVILPGDSFGVAGGRESAKSCAVTCAGGPAMMRSTGRNASAKRT